MKHYFIIGLLFIFGVGAVSAAPMNVEHKKPKVELAYTVSVFAVAPDEVNVAATAPTAKVERITVNEQTTTAKYKVYAARQSLPPRICTPSKAINITSKEQIGEGIGTTQNKTPKQLRAKWVWCR